MLINAIAEFTNQKNRFDYIQTLNYEKLKSHKYDTFKL